MTLTETAPVGLTTLIVSDGATGVIYAAGPIDVRTAPQLRHALVKAERNFQTVVLDLRGATCLDAAGLGVIATTLKHLHSVGDFRLRNPSRPVQRVLEVSGFDRFVQVEVSMGQPHGRSCARRPSAPPVGRQRFRARNTESQAFTHPA